MRAILFGLYGDWLWLDQRIDAVGGEIKEISRTEENCANVDLILDGVGDSKTVKFAVTNPSRSTETGSTVSPSGCSTPSSARIWNGSGGSLD